MSEVKPRPGGTPATGLSLAIWKALLEPGVTASNAAEIVTRVTNEAERPAQRRASRLARSKSQRRALH